MAASKKLNPSVVDPDYVLFVIGPYCWGKGNTIAEAKKRAKVNLPSYVKSPNFVAYVAPKDVRVNEFGALVWKSAGPAPIFLGSV